MGRRGFILISGVLVTALAVIAGSACGSFGDASPSAEGGTAPDGPAGDVPPVPPDAPLGRDGGCQGTPLFDDGFDQLPFGSKGWNITTQGTMEQRAEGPTPPALFTRIPVLTGTAVDHVLQQKFSLAGRGHSSVCVELDVKLEMLSGTFSTGAFAEVLDIRSEEGDELYLEIYGTDFVVTHDTDDAKLPGFVFGAWQHLVIQMSFGASKPATVTIDDQLPFVAIGPFGALPSALEITLGLDADSKGGTTAATQVHIDNFRITTAP